MLTEARIGLRGCAGAPTSTTGGGAGTEHGDEDGAGALRAPGWHGSTQGGPAGRIRGSGGLRGHRRRGIAVAEVLTGGVGALLRAEVRRGDALGLRAARGVDGVQGGLRALVKGTGRGLRRDKDPGDLAGDLGRPLRSREGRGEEALTGGAARSVAGRRARCGRARRQVGPGCGASRAG